MKEIVCKNILYYDGQNRLHKLYGPAVEWGNGCKSYYVNGIPYMNFNSYFNEIVVYPNIILLGNKYKKYLKSNIKKLIKKYNPTLYIKDFKAHQINLLPDFIKDLIIL